MKEVVVAVGGAGVVAAAAVAGDARDGDPDQTGQCRNREEVPSAQD